MIGKDQRIDRHLPQRAAQGAAQLQIAQMGTEDQDPLRPLPERLVGAVVDEFDLLVADLAPPARQLVQHRLAKAQEVTEAAAGLRRQDDATGRGEVFQPLQILGGGAALAHARDKQRTKLAKLVGVFGKVRLAIASNGV